MHNNVDGESSIVCVHPRVGRFDVASVQVFFGEANFVVVFLSSGFPFLRSLTRVEIVCCRLHLFYLLMGSSLLLLGPSLSPGAGQLADHGTWMHTGPKVNNLSAECPHVREMSWVSLSQRSFRGQVQTGADISGSWVSL